jgi:molybdopterin synthase catalytic subunit
MTIALCDRAIDVGALRDAVAHPSCGAILVFEGTARDTFEGRRVTALAYEAWADAAISEMTAIAEEIAREWPGSRVGIVHRTGDVPIGAVSVAIAVAAPHRGPCYEASRAAIERLKARVPIWKKEIYEDGSAWKANAPVAGQ